MGQTIEMNAGYSKQTLEAVARHIEGHLDKNKKTLLNDRPLWFAMDRNEFSRFNVHKTPLRKRFKVDLHLMGGAELLFADQPIAEVSSENGKIKVVLRDFHESINSLLEKGMGTPAIDRSEFEVISIRK